MRHCPGGESAPVQVQPTKGQKKRLRSLTDLDRTKALQQVAKRLGMVNQPLNEVAAAAALLLGLKKPWEQLTRWHAVVSYLTWSDALKSAERVGPPLVSLAKPKPRRERAVFDPPWVATPAFLNSGQWRRLRMRVLVARGAKCEACGATPDDGAKMCVDHVKPRLKFPELAMEETNLQVLCGVCNHGKGNWDETDWRDPALRPRLVSR